MPANIQNAGEARMAVSGRTTAGTILAVAVVAALTTAGARAAEPIAAAELLASNCFNCHGPYGASLGAIPALKGMNAELIARNLNQFKSGEKPSTIMHRIAKGYTDAEIVAIAKYLESAQAGKR
jgi:sulfide dehydrogenase cytochrome subunit